MLMNLNIYMCVSRLINIYKDIGNARTSYNMKRREYIIFIYKLQCNYI